MISNDEKDLTTLITYDLREGQKESSKTRPGERHMAILADEEVRATQAVEGQGR